MKYIEIKRFGDTSVLEMHEGVTPRATQGSLLVEVKAAGINYADIVARQGYYPPVKTTPYRPGYEVAGIVTEVGPGVEGYSPGERVAALVFTAGGYSTHALVPAEAVHRLPDNVDFGIAAGLLVQGLTAFFLLEESNLKSGECVLVSGVAGGVGSLAAQIARIKGARVLGLASKGKHELASRYGSEMTFDYGANGWSSEVLAATEGAGVDVFLDSQGDLGGEAFSAIGRLGRWMVYGGLAAQGKDFPTSNLWPFIFKNATLRGYTVDSNATEFGRAYAQLLGWVESGSLKVDVTRFAFKDVARAHQDVADRKTHGKVVLEP